MPRTPKHTQAATSSKPNASTNSHGVTVVLLCGPSAIRDIPRTDCLCASVSVIPCGSLIHQRSVTTEEHHTPVHREKEPIFTSGAGIPPASVWTTSRSKSGSMSGTNHATPFRSVTRKYSTMGLTLELTRGSATEITRGTTGPVQCRYGESSIRKVTTVNNTMAAVMARNARADAVFVPSAFATLFPSAAGRTRFHPLGHHSL